MKNHILSVGLLAALAVSCSVNEIDYSKPDLQTSEEFYAQFENPGIDPSTKVYATEDLYIRWNADDRITIFNKYTYNQEYRFNGETGDNSGSFKRVDNGDFVTGNSLDNIYAIYPYLESTKVSDTGVMTVMLPAEQHYAENTFGLGANTMISATTDNQLMFKNVGGYLMSKLYGDDVTVSSISLKGNNGEKLSGKATVTMPVNGIPTIEMASDAGEEITLVCDTPVKIGTTAGTATTFWLVVPPTTFSKGFTLTVKDNKNGVFEISTTKSFQISRNTLSRMSALEVAIQAPDPSDDAIVFADSKLKERLVAKFDTNGDGELSYKEAAAVTSFENVVNIKTITSFDEFQFFSGVTSIPDNCFKDWSRLQSIILPQSITMIGSYAFQNCTNLSSLVIPNSVTYLGKYDTFAGCSNLEHINIPEGVKSICYECFAECTSLKEIVFPESLTEIESDAFSNCPLSSIYLTKGITKLGPYIPFTCSNLVSIVVDSENPKYDSRNNCNAIIETASNKLLLGCSLSIIPESVTAIGNSAFVACTGLTSIILPDGITTIGNNAFAGCINLESINLPDSITYIDYRAFQNCVNLTSIRIPESVSSISSYTFAGCSNLVSIHIPESVSSIGSFAFSNCSSLKSITIPESVSRIAKQAFEYCSSLESVTIKAITPPAGSWGMFFGASNCPIYVPAESVDAYKTAEYWSSYADRIQAIPSVPVPEAVDLGLPSGIKWASFNLGASKPEEYGGYYAWGETEPYYSSQNPLTWKEAKELGYAWESYKWCMGSYNTLTKYCNQSSRGYNGFTDTKTVLDLEDDAAHVNLGGKWRIPTPQERAELSQYCTWTWTSLNGVNGYKVTSNQTGYTDKSIFLPAAGSRYETRIDYVGSQGYYWTSSLDAIYTSAAYNFYFLSDTVSGMNNASRVHGNSIRPVYAE